MMNEQKHAGYLLKEDQELPDAYEMKIYFKGGKEQKFEIAEHIWLPEGNDKLIIRFVTKDDRWNWIFIDVIARIEFDDRFSKIVEIKRKIGEKEAKEIAEKKAAEIKKKQQEEVK